MKPTVTIVGAGLSGSILASRLSQEFNVNIVESFDNSKKPLIDKSHLLGYEGSFSTGLGGTTKLWHNGLIEIDEEIFSRDWPFAKSELVDYYSIAFKILSHNQNFLFTDFLNKVYDNIRNNINKDFFIDCIVYPIKRINIWKHLHLKSYIHGSVIDFTIDNGRIDSVIISNGDTLFKLKTDITILCCGGIGTPALLQRTKNLPPSFPLENVGRFYEDHPMGFVAEFSSSLPFYKYWNLKYKLLKLNIRPLYVVNHKNIKFSFQVRPSYQNKPALKINSIITDLRNNPFGIKKYFSLLKNINDIFDILSFKMGLYFKTDKYSLFMVSEQPSSKSNSIEIDDKGYNLMRNWILDDEYFKALQGAIKLFFNKFDGSIYNINVFPNLKDLITSSSHHSGTSRMGSSQFNSVCDKNCKAYGIDNLYICDGSIIPSSGYANTGLTIAALSIRLSNFLTSKYANK